MAISNLPQPKISRFIFSDTSFAWVWLLLRIYMGYIWVEAGIEKFLNPAWIGDQAGVAITGFLKGALAKTAGEHPDVSSWYAYFVQNYALPNATLFSYLIVFGEIAVGTCLILGLFVGLSAFVGAFMNFNFLLAGTVSINPVMVLVQFLLILAWRTAGMYGLDRYTFPHLFKKRPNNNYRLYS